MPLKGGNGMEMDEGALILSVSTGGELAVAVSGKW